ncbi:MAG: UDP-N-acetylmuramoyl-tripeptide--D-alanyl-D-alanine ligase [Clostridiaceae bacterium]|nr:UDP-N-acetylmuramoyl-tripeptide--D-alanyl-D-alanine ligase [Eubacteriales bacterium]
MDTGTTAYAFWAVVAIEAAAAALAATQFIHMLQLESYQGKMYLKWLFRHAGDALTFLMVGIVALALRASAAFLVHYGTLVANIAYVGADALYVLMLLLMYFADRKKEKKKPLVYTGRVKRLIAVLFLLSAAFAASLFISVEASPNGIPTWGAFLLLYGLRYLPGALLPLFVFLAWLITYPLEEAVKAWYFNDARNILKKRTDLIKIGITGSYGKTSAKHALGEILKERYDVLYTPGSFNTPMGVSRVVREKLKDDHNVFIAEMGARYKGDIEELCRLVGPRYGIITSVGKQHLETFGSLENVVATKSELMEGIAENGACFFNGDNALCREMYETSKLTDKFLFGTDGDGLYMKASELSVSAKGSRFALTAQGGESVACETKLLGRHNIINIAGAAALAHFLGLTLEEIAAAIARLKPVEHRLELIEGPVTVIDDAFNSNPEGAKEALEVLKSFSGKRIVVTPGMVELGGEESALNRAFGQAMAKAADVAILVGYERAEPIREGLMSLGFDEKNIVKAKSLNEAAELLKLYTEPGAAVLFENDLPDNYDE